jgi:hypothetical protein
MYHQDIKTLSLFSGLYSLVLHLFVWIKSRWRADVLFILVSITSVDTSKQTISFGPTCWLHYLYVAYKKIMFLMLYIFLSKFVLPVATHGHDASDNDNKKLNIPKYGTSFRRSSARPPARPRPIANPFFLRSILRCHHATIQKIRTLFAVAASPIPTRPFATTPPRPIHPRRQRP